MRGEFVLYINHSGKYIEIDINMKIPYIMQYSPLRKSLWEISLPWPGSGTSLHVWKGVL